MPAASIPNQYRRIILNILLIANQQRLQNLVAEAASLSGAHLQVAPTLADLPADAAAAPPDLIFLQNRVSGLSAEILSRHIRNQLSPAGDPTIVVLTDSAGDAPEERTLETVVSDEELLATISQMVHSEKRRRDESASVGAPEPTVPRAETTSLANGDFAGTEDTAPADDGSPEEFDVVSLGGRPADGTVISSPKPQTLNFREELESLTGPPRAETPTGHTPSPFLQSVPAADGRRPKALLWTVVAVSTLAAGIVLFLSMGEQPTPPVPQQQQSITEKRAPGITDKPAATGSGVREQNESPDMPALPEPSSPPATAATKGVRKASLPSFIPPQSIVPDNSNKQPGWERYITPELEFRIFRKGTDIDALQVIDRTGKGMSRSFFTRAILEMVEVRDYRLQSREVKGDYLIKRGTLTANAGVILYKKKDDTQLRAFVIHYK